MNAIEFKQKNQFTGINWLIGLVGLIFLLYVGSSLINSTKRFRQQSTVVEVGF